MGQARVARLVASGLELLWIQQTDKRVLAMRRSAAADASGCASRRAPDGIACEPRELLGLLAEGRPVSHAAQLDTVADQQCRRRWVDPDSQCCLRDRFEELGVIANLVL